MVCQVTLLELLTSPHPPAFCLTAFGGKSFTVEAPLLVLLHENIQNSRNVSHVYWKLSNSYEILQIHYSQYISFCAPLTSLLSHSIIYLSGPTALSLCRCDSEYYLSPDNASPSHTQYPHTGRKFSDNIRNKTFFQRKKRGETEDLVLPQCQWQPLPYIYTADVKEKLHFLCQKSLIFLLLSSPATSVHFTFNCKLRFSVLWGRTPFVLPCNQSM